MNRPARNLGLGPNDLPKLGALSYGTKSELVYQRLRQAVVGGEFPPGQVIDQAAISAELHVSRMPLRQALLKLEADKLIELRPHHTAIVAQMSARAIEEIYAMREGIEPILARAGVPHLTDADLDALEELNKTMRKAVSTRRIESFVQLDRSFHRRLYAASGYDRALEETERLRDGSDRYVAFYASYKRRANSSVREHESILRVCRSRNAVAVERLTRDHVKRGALVVLGLVGKSEGLSGKR